jgi:hypothetical protein
VAQAIESRQVRAVKSAPVPDWGLGKPPVKEQRMSTENTTPDQNDKPVQQTSADVFDGLKDKKPEDLTPEELRLMADTMPGEGPGD